VPDEPKGPLWPVQRLNHIVLYVSDARRTAKFYTDVLDFKTLSEVANGKAIFMRAPGSTNDHDLGLFQLGPNARPSEAGRSTVGLYHMAWEVDTLAELERIARCSPTGAPSSERRTTAPRRPSTQRILTASSSRSLGSSRPTPSSNPIVRSPTVAARPRERKGAFRSRHPGGVGVSTPARV